MAIDRTKHRFGYSVPDSCFSVTRNKDRSAIFTPCRLSTTLDALMTTYTEPFNIQWSFIILVMCVNKLSRTTIFTWLSF